LLRADNAALCVGFLRDVFRVDRAIARPQQEMISRLTSVIEEINDEEDTKRFPRHAKAYLDAWVQDGALSTHYAEDGSIHYELTPEADTAFLFYDQIGERADNTRGAKSKLRTILDILQKITRDANPDRQARIDEIDRQINLLKDERLQLASGLELRAATPEQLAEEYEYALEVAQRLLSDFSRIRQRFREVAQDLAERYASTDVSRGALLEQALNAHQELNDGDLGQSFGAFRDYLGSDSTQSSLFSLIDTITAIPALEQVVAKDSFLPSMPSNLMREAKAVIDQTRRLSADLRRMLDAQSIAARQETREELAALRALTYALSDRPPEGDILEVSQSYAEISGTEIALRSSWREPPPVITVGDIQAHPGGNLNDAKKAFQGLASVDLVRLRKQIDERLLSEEHGFRLTEMLAWFPPRRGEWLFDVIGYLEIARHPKSHHVIKSDAEYTWVYTPSDNCRAYNLPQILFFR